MRRPGSWGDGALRLERLARNLGWLWGLSAIGWAAMAAAEVPGEEPVRLAQLPIVVYSAGDHDYLREGLGAMLASRIGQDPQLRVIRVEDPAAATNEAEVAREAARAAGADYVLYGSFTRFGEGASLDLQCVRVDGDELGRREFFVQSGTLPEIIPKLDPLSEKVARFVTGTAGGAAPAAAPPELPAPAQPDELEELRARLKALEAAVFVAPETPGEAREAPPGEEPPGRAGESSPGEDGP